MAPSRPARASLAGSGYPPAHPPVQDAAKMPIRFHRRGPCKVRNRGPLQWLSLLVLSLCLGFAGATANADNDGDRRVRTGARLFRALLAADMALESRVGEDGALHVVVYGSDARFAAEVAKLIAPPDDLAQAQVRGIPIKVELIQQMPSGKPPAGLFLASRPRDEDLATLVQWSIRHKVIAYSPFEGHVERGFMAGLSIEAKVQPYVNRGTLDASGIRLKPFFLKVAKVRQ